MELNKQLKTQNTMKNYAHNRKEHLAEYAKNNKLPIGGTYNGRPYEHILKLDKNKIDIVKDFNILKDVNKDMLTEKLHRFAHHLNSSQILCYNFFMPMLTDKGKASKQLVNLLEKYGIKIEEGAECKFEYNDNLGDNTEFDFHIKSGNIEVFFEIKYTEYGFGRAKKDERHKTKFDTIYKKELGDKHNALQTNPDCEEFLNKYQLYRNAIRIKDKNKYLILLYPELNKVADKQAKEFIKEKINNEFRDNVQIIYWEKIADEDTELYRKYFK